MMDIAVVGSEAALLCDITNIGARAFHRLSEVTPGNWDILALAQPAACVSAFHGLNTHSLNTNSLLLPGGSDPSIAKRIPALQLIGYGFSPRDTLTLSSFARSERMVCLQRSLLTVWGELLEPQELPLSAALSGLSEEQALLAAGICLLSCEKHRKAEA